MERLDTTMWSERSWGSMTVLSRVAPVLPAPLVMASPWADLDRRLSASPQGRFVLDLRDERYLTSEALAALVTLVRRIQQAGGTLVLVTDQPAVISVLESTRLARLVPVVPRIEALAPPTAE